jgi:peptide/nickel transport system permease protein
VKTQAASSPALSIESRQKTRRRRRLGGGAALLVPLVVIGLVGFISPLLPLKGPNDQDLTAIFLPPVGFGGHWAHPLGTDQLGRDMLARMAYGARLSFEIAIASVVCAGVIGASLGIAAGYLRGWVDVVVTRLIDAQLALPFLLLAIAIIATRGQSLPVLIGVLAISGWAQYARVLRAETLALRQRPFITGLRAAGMSTPRITFFHVLPNLASTLVVIATLEVGTMIIGEGALSFLGLGVTAPNVSWGLMLAEGRNYLQQGWWLVVFPGVAIGVVVLLANLGGDALRSRYDPRKAIQST